MIVADAIWYGGAIRTMDPHRPYATAIAVAGTQIVAVGNDTDVLNVSGPKTKKINLDGKQIIPGLVESHTHALWGACRDLFDVHVGYQASFDELMLATVQRVSRSHPNDVVSGGPWRPDMRQHMGSNPRDVLDQISTDIAIVLTDVTQHIFWCNSYALERAGIGEDASDVEGGIIERDPGTGKPNGVLVESACSPVRKLISRTPRQLCEATRYFVDYLNRLGFTSFKEPMAMEEELKAYRDADQRGELTLNAAAHIVRQSPLVMDFVSYETMEHWRKKYASQNLRTDFAKLFLDGVAPGFTASFLEPYLASSGYDTSNHRPDDTLLIAPDTLAETFVELDSRGFTVKVHSVGDNATRHVLDAIEAARITNGNSGLRHEVAHASFIDRADLPRFAKLNAVAEVSPKLWFPNPATAGQLEVLGKERVERCHPIRDYLNAGMEVTYASDWPAAAPDPNPWIGLAGMLSRSDPTGRYPGTLGADQAINLDEALPLFTTNGARSLRMEEKTGSLSIGKQADFLVLDRPLETLTTKEIAAIEPRQTIWNGQVVHER